MKKIVLLSLISIFVLSNYTSAQSSYQIAVLKYGGGGDWYSNPTSLPNLIEFCNQNLKTNIKPEVEIVEVGSVDLFNYPFIHMTGHGNVIFSDEEANNLRTYLLSGGFLHIDDNYGMDPFIRTELKKVFPNEELTELPTTHPVFNQKYKFKDGLPKIHEHDKKKPQLFGIFIEGNIVLLYTYETDLGDGWEDPSVHQNPWPVRESALKMGVNIIYFALSQ